VVSLQSDAEGSGYQGAGAYPEKEQACKKRGHVERPGVPVSAAAACHPAVPQPRGAGSLPSKGSRGPGPGPEHASVPGPSGRAGR